MNQPILRLQQPNATQAVVTLDSPRYEPNWRAVIETVLVTACAERRCCAIASEPAVWDTELAEIAPIVRRWPQRVGAVVIAALSGDDHAALRRIAASTDFQLGALTVALLDPLAPAEGERLTALLAALRESPAGNLIATNEQLLDCADDDWLTWHNPPADRLAALCQALDAQATSYGWRLETA